MTKEQAVKHIKPLLLSSTLILASCTNTSENNPNSQGYTPRSNNPYLTEQQAQYRASRISDVNYQLDFNLSEQTRFNATAELSFKLSGIEHPITIDLSQAQIKSLKINGNAVIPQYNQSFITVAPTHLHHGHNVVSIAYSRAHSTNGEGLHRFKDPVDGKVYLYSHFEPAAANQMFPSFDQPDLKAQYTVTVLAPKDWHVVTAMRESSTTVIADKKRWHFNPTPKLSTYNFSLHAGPYKVWTDNSGKYPARLFARQSVANQVVPQTWFEFTHQGIGFFEQYFAIDYPFKKYDQLLVPDFLYGAMENAAAVTFAERAFLNSGKNSKAREESLASTIMHEMAHQWFGDLVTMKWWNGLWLNESFAAFMASIATAQSTKFDYAWRTFYAGEKQRAYTADQRITTHPIEVPVASTANAFDNIDAITYSKGASVLQQLRYLLTPEVFRQGVRNYLLEYSYKNATLDDFIESLSKTANRDLTQWKQQWLYQPGVNTIAVDYQCDNQQISAFNLKQSAPKRHPVLREQKVNIALLNKDDQGHLQLSHSLPVIYQGANTQVDALIGSPCPDLVYPNYQDWAFVKVTLDKQSFTTAKSSIGQVSDPLLRSMLWQSLWDSARDGLLPLNEYLSVAIDNVAAEQDYTILNQILANITTARRYLDRFGTHAEQYRQQVAPKLEQLAWQALKDKKDQANHLRSWFNALLTFSSSQSTLNNLKDILQGKQLISNLNINQSLRWSIIEILNQHDVSGSLALIDTELAKDNSDNGQKRAIAAKARRPDIKQKRYWLSQFNAQKADYPFAKLRVAMSNIYPTSQQAIEEVTADSVVATLAQLDKSKGPVFMRSYAANLIPAICSDTNVERLSNAIEQYPKLSSGTKSRLLRIHQNTKRCLKMAKKLSQ